MPYSLIRIIKIIFYFEFIEIILNIDNVVINQ